MKEDYDISNLPEFDAGYYNGFAVGTLFKLRQSVFKVVYNAQSDCENCCNQTNRFFGCGWTPCAYKNFILFDEIPDEE